MDSITGSEPKKAEIETIDGEESIKGDKYIHQEKIDFSGLGDGNYLLIGSEVNISSQKLTGNVLILADKITISGNVTGSVVAAGETITLSGSVQDLYTTGKNVVIENGAYIERALKCWNENLNIKGGQVGYEVYSVSSHTTIAKEAYLPEKIAYSGELEAPDNIKEIATVIEGAMEMQEASQMIETAANTMIKVLKTVYVLMSGLVNLIIIIILANLMKKSINEEELSNKPINRVLHGLLYYIIMFAIVVVCFITIVLIPVAIGLLFVIIPLVSILTVVGEILFAHILLKDSASKTGFVVLTAAVCDLLLRLMIFTPVGVIGSICKLCLGFLGIEFFIRKLGLASAPKNPQTEVVYTAQVDNNVKDVSEETGNDNKEE